MNEAKPGARLAGRYRLVERLSVSPDESTWRAVDATLDRQVVVWILRPGHPFADDVLDSARLVALIDDKRLVKVLDVGTDSGANGDRAYVVNEAVEGETLESMVQRRPLAAPAARRIAGETAEGLAAAAGRGLHHLRLTPRMVTVTSKGLIKVSGLAVQAAAAGLDPGHATRANRADATAVVGLLYSALTGRWPLGDAGFPPAQRSAGGGPVAAADLVPDVPADLNDLCRRVLGEGAGPDKPADVALELTPWSSAAQADLVNFRAPSSRPAAAVTDDGPATSEIVPTAPAAALPTRPAPPGRPATGQQPPVRPQQPAARAGDERFRPSPPVMPPPMTAPAGGRPPVRPGLGPAPLPGPSAREGARPTQAGPPSGFTQSGSSQSSTAKPSTTKPTAKPGTARPGTPRPNPPAPSTPATSTPPTSTPPNNAPRTGRPVPVRPGPSNGTNGNGHRGNGHNSVPSTGEQLMPWATSWSPSTDAPSALESTGPFPLVLPQQTPPPAQSRQVLLAVLGVLAVLVVIAAFTLRGLLPGGDRAEISPGAASATGPSLTDPTTTSAPSASSSASATPGGPAPAVAPQIAAIRAIDPQADGDENTADSPLAVDGDTSSSWASQRYDSARFGGLKKGLGLAIRLKQRTVISEVQVDLRGSGGRVQLRLGPSSDVAASKVVDSTAINGATTTLTPNRSMKTRYVILWFTELPRTDEGYKAEVVEVRVK